MTIVLHNYFRSSTSFRVRVALRMKGLEHDYVAHHLRKGEHRDPAFLKINPQGLLPAMIWDGTALTQSLAILEFLEEVAPEPPLLPSDPLGRARVRALSQMIGCDVHPVNNLRVLNALRARYGADDADVADWFRTWVAAAFGPLEAALADGPEGRFCHGDAPGMADICLVAQVANNARFEVDMAPYPRIRAIHETCMAIPAFAEAAPAAQPDAE